MTDTNTNTKQVVTLADLDIKKIALECAQGVLVVDLKCNETIKVTSISKVREKLDHSNWEAVFSEKMETHFKIRVTDFVDLNGTLVFEDHPDHGTFFLVYDVENENPALIAFNSINSYEYYKAPDA